MTSDKPFWDCLTDPACDPIEELHKRLGVPTESSSLSDEATKSQMGRAGRSISDFIRMNNIGGDSGKNIADAVDHAIYRLADGCETCGGTGVVGTKPCPRC